jgi:hypothetical protein
MMRGAMIPMGSPTRQPLPGWTKDHHTNCRAVVSWAKVARVFI